MGKLFNEFNAYRVFYFFTGLILALFLSVVLFFTVFFVATC